MEGPSRRTLLSASGALGAFGALSLASPARARTLWTWAPSGSVAGEGAGIDPEWVWDEEADPVLASVIERGDVPSVNEALRRWTRNDQAPPAGLPSDLRDFIEEARRLPSWADRDKLERAAAFNESRGLYLNPVSYTHLTLPTKA